MAEDYILQNLLEKKYPSVSIQVMEGFARLTLDRLIVSENSSDKNISRHILEDIISYADKHNKTIALKPPISFVGSLAKIRKFYKEKGFVLNKGKNKAGSNL